MERQTTFVNVILPLALPRMLTYRVPQADQHAIRVGQRVIVQLGKTKLYTAVVFSISHEAPVGYTARYIESILDPEPIIHNKQLEMWEWMAEYYCCTHGEVMNAALPAGLKLASESKFILIDDLVESSQALSEHEITIVNALAHRKTMSMAEICDLLQISHIQPYIKSLLQKKIIASEEEIKEKYKPKFVEYITPGIEANTEKKLQLVFAELEKRNAAKQSDTLLTFLKLSKWDEGKQQEVTRLNLQQAAGVNASVIAAMEEKGIFKIESKETGRLASHLISAEKTRALSESQIEAHDSIKECWQEKDVALLHGVTSSGKTEVYARLIEETINEGKQVLFLLPEIALTTQIIGRLIKYFGKRMGVYHSGYSNNERTEVWNKVLSDTLGECDVILGARSALFLPFTRLGLIIVDEEHEPSFKQHDPAPRYHARDTAIWLARQFSAKVLLGSATPAVETYWNALHGKFGLIEMNTRYGGLELPEIDLCDLRVEIKNKTLKNHFSSQLLTAMEEVLSRGEQIILFQNRRGYTPIWECTTCGNIPMCTRCDVSLTYHKQLNQLRCHYCGYHTPPQSTCSHCGSHDMRMLGFGTEKIEEDLQTFLPGAVAQRMDFDTTRTKTGYQKIISDFESGRTNVLVGTQMVTKGLDFDNVALVGILQADKMLHYPDFRSIERAYQLMMQVAGRAGRKTRRGHVIIQTYNPDHWLFPLLKTGDFKSLYQHEISERMQFGYPPFVRLMRITLKHREDEQVQYASEILAQILRPYLNERILGPEKPFIPKINNYFIRQFIIKLERKPDYAKQKSHLIQLIREHLAKPEFKTIKLSIDVDPV